ncbi:MAG: ATP-binding protein [Cyclobacteriaceae bacterium]
MLVALSQWVTHIISKNQAQDANLINLAKKQRFLGQQIAKLSLQTLYDPLNDAYWNQLMETELIWRETFQAFQNKILPEQTSSDAYAGINEVLIQIQPQQENISRAVKSLFLEFDDDKFLAAIQLIQLSETDYSAGMEAVTVILESQAEEKTTRWQRGAALLSFFSCITLLLEYLLIFRPAFKHVKEQNDLLNQSFREQQILIEELTVLEKRAENSLKIQKNISENLKEAKHYAEQASQTKGKVLSTMSHEIRTPLNSMLGITHLLLEDQPKANQIENLKALQFSAQNLKSLINDILDMSRIESGRVELEQEPFNLEEVVQRVFQPFIVQAEEKEIALNLIIDPEIPQFVRGDATRLSQILNNLVSNAIKFTLEGYVNISLNAQEKKADNVRIGFEIEDTGIGISEDKINTIFEEYIQAEPGTNRKFGGTGLGLAITKKLLQLHNSDIEVESSPGHGTTFSFELHYGVVAFAEQAEDSKIPQITSGKIVGLRVLVAEDNKLNVAVLRQFLKKWGVQFDVAEDGEKAVAYTRKQTYDVILMDIHMPKMDGLTASRHIRQQGITTPIVALTASTLSEIQEQLIQAGIDDFTTKPFIPELLYGTLAKYQVLTSDTKNPDEKTN